MSDDDLFDTIRLLSPMASSLLLAQSRDSAHAIVGHLRALISYWESSHVALDPIQREVILDSLVLTFAVLYKSFDSSVSALALQVHALLVARSDGSEVHDDQGIR